jgi:uncharacterized protein (TIGR02265 family)
MAEGVIYRHTVEAFIERVLLRRGLLSLEFDRELKALGVDASRPAELKLETWLALLKASARRLGPDRSEDDALEDVGREMLRGYIDGLVGRALFTVLRLIGPRRALLRMAENFHTADSITSVTARELGPSSIELEFKPVFGIPTYTRGVLLEALVLLRAKDAKVEFKDLPTDATLFTVSWAA